MAVEAGVKPVIMDDSDDDDMPLVFKRNNNTSKQNSKIELNSSETRSLNGQSSKTSNSFAKSAPIGNLKASSSGADQSKRPPQQKPAPTSKVKSSSISSKTSNLSAKSPIMENPKADSSSSDKSKLPPPRKSTHNNEKSPAISSTTSNISTKSPPIGNLKKASSSGADQSRRLPLKQTPTFKEKSPTISSRTSNSSSQSPPIGDLKASNKESSPTINSKMSNLSSKSTLTGNPEACASGAEQLKLPPLNKPTSTVNEEKKPNTSTFKPENPGYESEDSEDTKPLSARVPSGLSKINSGHVNQEEHNSNQKLKVETEDSDDEIPLSTKFQKSNADEKKPVGSKLQQNGASQVKKSPTMLNKRPLSEVNNSSNSSIKKPKLVDGFSPSSSKQVPAKPKKEEDDEEEDHLPISQRIKKASTSAGKSPALKKEVTKVVSKTTFKKTTKTNKKMVKNTKFSKSSKMQPGSGDGQKWTSFVHNGVIFPPPYTPHGVKMFYKGKPVDLTPEQEEVATMYAVMLETDYMTKPKFKENFMADWRKILGKNHVIQKLEDCDFRPIYEWHQREKEKKKQMTSEEKKVFKEEKLKQEEKYMWAIVDGVKEKVGNFRVEPPGLFRGRGEHPKMGKLKKRIWPSDITINIGKNTPIPECPFPDESWREVRHDNTVTWLAYWNDPINPKEFKYVFLAASSSWKGQSDKEKYEKARTLKHYIQGIRAAYTKDFTNKDVTKKQIAIATYLIDKLALRAGNEKDDDEADTVGCCTLKVENVEPLPPNILKFDFLGKDSIRYQNEVEVELPVFKAIQQFRVGKKGGDNLFDQLDTSKLNAVLKELMPGLTAKVFRTYNASITLDEMLSKGTKGGDLAEKVVVYQHANKEVAIICNHQRTVSKTHSAQMTRLNDKIDELKGILDELKTDLSRAKKGKPPLKGSDGKNKRNLTPEALERKIAQTNAKIEKMERDKDSKEDLKTVALGTSKINYLDPRITVAWCKRYEVPIEKMFNKALLEKFSWAMDVEPDFRF